ncbi:helix-turn-helix transcriptional regulator [Aminithiophilus ramosus]|uniref:Helix-turn-helix transcriptional regulator n=1 Tax=Aminithiophilus ramosus TaxID=3029084 RepID=A0A9Q7AR53_9BACT|nr:helix-turn-helix transcriptional regulator [Aminithiophilus ramosus]QTX33242.1 helix-turn-helix transcriptional regulator [Aminithiophilus ramosus]
MFSERLKSLRKARGVTQKALAASLGLSERHYQGIEYGETKPGFDNLIALADYFDVSLDYLVGRSDNPGR